MLNTPFSPWPSVTVEEADAVRACLLSNKVNYWTGKKGMEFEKKFIMKKLQENEGNISKTADSIGLERSNLHRKIKTHSLESKKE